MKKKSTVDLSLFAKAMGTKPRKSDSGIGELVKYRTKTLKGVLHTDLSGGINLKVPGMDFFINNGTILEQIKDIEERIAAYEALKPDIKKLKAAVLKSQPKIPEKVKPHVTNR